MNNKKKQKQNPTLFYTSTGIGIKKLSSKAIENNLDYIKHILKEAQKNRETNE